MSCNGCRALRKGCSEACILRPCLQWIDSPESQGHATVFVAKFFGRAGLMSFICNVPEPQRPALFQSLLFDACGRTVNPVTGAVGLLGSGNFQFCQEAVETVLRGEKLRPIRTDLLTGRGILPASPPEADESSEEEATCSDMDMARSSSATKNIKPAAADGVSLSLRSAELDLCLSHEQRSEKRRRPRTPSVESGTSFEQGHNGNFQMQEHQRRNSEVKLLKLFR